MDSTSPAPSFDDYSVDFYDYMDEQAATSADVVVGELCAHLPIHSVVDVGCGTGAWLEAFTRRGVTDVLGVDQPDVPLDRLRIEPSRFHEVDLAAPGQLDRRFDLAMSLEVAEHLPDEAADDFVGFLCTLAPVIVFSAAVPGQGGTGHINEQWPEYWAAKFDARGFRCIDSLRPRFWSDDRIAPFYRQNLLLFADRETELPAALSGPALPLPPLGLVHPGLFGAVRAISTNRSAAPVSFRAALRGVRTSFTAAVQRRVPRRRGS